MPKNQSDVGELDAEDAPFLIQDARDSHGASSRWNRTARSASTNNLVLHCLLILAYTAVSIAIIFSFHEPASQRRHNALHDIDISYESRQFSLMRDSPYIGPPSASVDAAWNNLFSTMSLRVSPSELSQHHQASVALPKGGHLAWLGVYHELHCVKVLRQVNYREHYHPNVTGQELRDLQVHADHCVDLLREAVMCHGDTESLTTFVWSEGWAKPLLSPQRPQHRCMDWGALVGSLKGRIVGEEEMDGLEKQG